MGLKRFSGCGVQDLFFFVRSVFFVSGDNTCGVVGVDIGVEWRVGIGP